MWWLWRWPTSRTAWAWSGTRWRRACRAAGPPGGLGLLSVFLSLEREFGCCAAGRGAVRQRHQFSLSQTEFWFRFCAPALAPLLAGGRGWSSPRRCCRASTTTRCPAASSSCSRWAAAAQAWSGAAAAPCRRRRGAAPRWRCRPPPRCRRRWTAGWRVRCRPTGPPARRRRQLAGAASLAACPTSSRRCAMRPSRRTCSTCGSTTTPGGHGAGPAVCAGGWPALPAAAPACIPRFTCRLTCT